jgi:DNA polymerase (family X)
MPIRNPDIADIFVAFSDHFEMEGENPFMIRTYRNASRTLYGMVAGAERYGSGAVRN